MKKFSLILMLFTLLLTTACGSTDGAEEAGAESNGQKRIAVVLKTLSGQHWKFVEAGAKAAGEELGVDVTVIGPSSESQIMEQVNMVEDSINQQPDALVVAPIQPSTIIPTLSGAEQQDIPVILVDTDVELEHKLAFIGTDNYTAGEEGGKLLASMLQKGDKVALISGLPGNTAIDARIAGAKKVLEDAGMVIAAEQPADSDKAKALTVMENILQNNADIKGVFSGSANMALGVIRAAESKGLDIPVIATDATVEAVESIVNGSLTGTIAQKPYEMGYAAVENALNAINGEEVEKRIDTGVDIITEENAQETLEELQKIVE
jgi:ribose transport system substrate-binding protein